MIDLSMIQDKINNKVYEKFEEFDDDITLMVTNANTHRVFILLKSFNYFLKAVFKIENITRIQRCNRIMGFLS